MSYSFSASTEASAPAVLSFIMLLVTVALTNVSSSYTATMTSATLTFSLSNTGCVGSASVNVYHQICADQVNCQCPQTFSTNEQSTNATVPLVITDLRAGVTYCYCSEVMNAGAIIGFENGYYRASRPSCFAAHGECQISGQQHPPLRMC